MRIPYKAAATFAAAVLFPLSVVALGASAHAAAPTGKPPIPDVTITPDPLTPAYKCDVAYTVAYYSWITSGHSHVDSLLHAERVFIACDA